jgi:UDP-glucuronate 4-epimerase
MSPGRQTVLITGGAGFIGSHLAERLLHDGDRVVILDNFNDFYDPEIKRRNISLAEKKDPGGQLSVVEGDLRDASLVRRLFADNGFDLVYHLAAMAGVRPSIKSPALYFDVNVNGTLHILEAAVEHGQPGVLFASSSSVYGGSPNIPFSEDDPVNQPVSPYAASKKAGELICHTFHHLYGLDISCLRFFTVYGPRQRPEMAVHLFADKIEKGEKVPMFGDGNTSRDYTYIDDIIDGVLAAAERCKGYEIYNLGNNEPVKLNDLIRKLGSTLARSPVIEQLPLPAGDVLQTWADISKAARDLGYTPTIDLDEGLKRFVQWFRGSLT